MTAADVVTVVVPARNAATTLGRQLDALERQRDAAPFEVIVVDNGSTDGTADIALARGLRVVTEPTPGINRARNAGIAAAADGLVLLCDADDEVQPGWIAAMRAAATPKCWLAGRLDYDTLNDPLTRSRWGAVERSSWVPGTSDLSATYGCNCGFWRAMWEEVGRFDDRLSGAGADETEFFTRAAAAGFRAVHVADALVAYRLRRGWSAPLKGRFRQGRNQVRMAIVIGGGGPRGREVSVALAKLALQAPWAVLTAARRRPWMRGVGLRVGHVVQLLEARR